MKEDNSQPLFSTTVSVIIVNYNGHHLLKTCLESLSRQRMRDFEVIVVDNGSQDGSVGWLETLQYPWIKTILLGANMGFGVANNRGFEASTGRYIVILNNDTEVPPDFLGELIAPLQDPSYSMVAPLIVYKDRPDRIDKAGGHRLYPDGLNRGRGCGRLLTAGYQTPGPCFYPDGCAAAFRRELIEHAGFFDEGFYLYGEDTDLGLKYRRCGALCWYQPSAIVYHVHSATAGKYSPQKAYFVERNRYRILLLNFPIFWILISPLFTLVRYIFQAIAALTGLGSPGGFSRDNSRWSLLTTLYRANRDGMQMIPHLIPLRKARGNLFTIGGLKFSGLLFRYFLSPTEIAFRD